jgi:hypothetical protein
MASNQAPIVDRIRIIPRPDDFLDRNVGNSGEVFFDKQAKTLRVYSGNDRGGFTVLTSANLQQNLLTSGVAAVEYTVTVGTDPDGIESGNKYFIDGEYKPALELLVGYTYIFNQNDQTNEYFPNPEGGANNQHPLNFSSDNANGELGGGTLYNTNVIYLLDDDPVTKQVYWDRFSGASQRSVQITITKDTPTTLYYWCQQHLNMGNEITTALPGTGGGGASIEVSESAPQSPSAGAIWFNSTTGRIYVYIEDVDSSQWVQPTFNIPSLLTDLGIADGTNGQVLTTDGAGNFTFQDATGGNSIGNFTFSSSNITTDDSSSITIVPPVVMNADLTVQNDLIVSNKIVSNKITADTFQSTSTGVPLIDSASTITLSAPDGVIVNNGPFRLPNLNDSERDALVAVNGDMIYNTTSNRPEMYIDGAWKIIDNSPIV